MGIKNSLRKGVALAAIAAASITGCGTAMKTIPGTKTLAPVTAKIPEGIEDDLRFIEDVRRYGRESMGYTESPHYTKYDVPETLYLAYITEPTELPESRQDYRKSINSDQKYRDPLEEPVLLRSKKDTLEDEAEYYSILGYDTHWRAVTDYNGSGGCTITPTFIEKDRAYQAKTILHENWHHSANEEWIGHDLSEELDEAIATFVGYQGAIDYFRDKEGEGSDNHSRAVKRFETIKKTALGVNEAYGSLKNLYARPELSLDEKMEQRAEIFMEVEEKTGLIDVNNADLWSRRTYYKYIFLIERLHNSLDGDLEATVYTLSRCPEDEKRCLRHIWDQIREIARQQP